MHRSVFILAASIAFSRVLTLMQVPQEISAWILAHFTNKIVLLLVLNVIFTDRWNGDGYNSGNPDPDTDPASDR